MTKEHWLFIAVVYGVILCFCITGIAVFWLKGGDMSIFNLKNILNFGGFLLWLFIMMVFIYSEAASVSLKG